MREKRGDTLTLRILACIVSRRVLALCAGKACNGFPKDGAEQEFRFSQINFEMSIIYSGGVVKWVGLSIYPSIGDKGHGRILS